jgi:glutaminyl-peptide cyclotransferase
MNRLLKLELALAILVFAAVLVACGKDSSTSSAASTIPPPAANTGNTQGSSSPGKYPPSATGFSGDRAYDFVAKQVAFGPRPPDTDAIRKTQDYIIGQLKSFGCQVDSDDFHANTPNGRLAMKNIVAKIPGKSPNIILLGTHYDTDTIDAHDQKMTNFVGADDGGSSTGVMLEIARVLCGKPQLATIWIAFFDGEEAFKHWSETDSCFGSREMAAKLAASGELTRVKAFVLADLVGYKDLRIKQEGNSTPWLADIVWGSAVHLGQTEFFNADKVGPIEDDHLPFVHRNVPSLDVIGDVWEYPHVYWHTPQDTLDKISPRSLQAVGDVILNSLPEIANHIH